MKDLGNIQGIEWNDRTGGASIRIDSIQSKLGHLSSGDEVVIDGKTMRVTAFRKGKVYFKPVESVMASATVDGTTADHEEKPVNDASQTGAARSTIVDESVDNEITMDNGSTRLSAAGQAMKNGQQAYQLDDEVTVLPWPGLSGKAYTVAGHTHKMIDAIIEKLDSLRVKTINGLKRAGHWSRSAFQRANRGWSDDDACDLGFMELRRLSGLLEQLSIKTYGYPSQYVREDWLNSHEDDYDEWLKSPARTIGRIADDSSVDFATAFNETVEDYGVEASAWMQDLHHASLVLKEYVDRADVEAICDEADLYGREESDRRSKAIEDEFQRTWAWIGRWILSMWN